MGETDRTYLSVADTGAETTIRYQIDGADETYTADSPADAVRFYNEELKSDAHAEQFFIGDYDADLIDHDTPDVSGRGRDGQWYVDPITIGKKAYLGAGLDALDRSRERLATELATVDTDQRQKALAQIVSEHADVSDAALVDRVALRLGAVTLEELCHAFSEYEHPPSFSFEHPNPHARETADTVLDGALDEYQAVPDGGTDTLTFVTSTDETDAVPAVLNRVLDAFEVDGSLEFEGAYRFDGEDAFFEDLVAPDA